MSTSKPWLLGDGSKTTDTDLRTRTYRYDHINEALILAGIVDQSSFSDFATYLGYSTGGSGQDMQVAWTPTGTKLGEAIGFATFGDIPQDTLVFDCVTSINGFSITQTSTPTSFSAPNLTSIDSLVGTFQVSGNTGFTTISAPLLATTYGVDCSGNPALTTVHFESLATTVGAVAFTGAAITTLDLSSLVTAALGLNAASCPNLTTVILPVFVPTNGTSINFSGGNLNAASVNQILARAVANAGYVTGIVDVSGGTSDAPTGQGILDKATLNGRTPGLAVTN